MQFLILDTETTGIEDGRLLQLAFKLFETDGDLKEVKQTYSGLFKPPVPIEIGAMATHHIDEDDVKDEKPFAGSHMQKRMNELCTSSFSVIHNAKFDVGVLNRENVEVKYPICTLKLAKYLFPDMESHALQYLRYALNLNSETLKACVAHDALGDVSVLEEVFKHIYGLMVAENDGDVKKAVTEMVMISSRPVLIKMCRFKKHKDKEWAQVAKDDRGYLEWLHGEESKKPVEEQDEDLVYTLNYYLNPPKSP